MSGGVTGRGETADAREQGVSSWQNNGLSEPGITEHEPERSAVENSKACPLLQMMCGVGMG